jgi:peptidoglycan/LPS O-acetylase OafA/YrhL
MEPGETKPQRLPEMRALMGLRFVAAIGVFLLHYSFFTQASLYPHLTTEELPKWMLILREVYYRQTFFFVLSGFTLGYVYHTRLATLTKQKVKTFWRARVARIWPLHVFFVLAMLPTQHREVREMPGETLAVLTSHLTLTQSWFSSLILRTTPGDEQTWTHAFNPPAWALSVEAFLYLCFPLVLWLLGSKWHLRSRYLALIAGACWAVIALFGLAFHDASFETITHWLYEFPPARLLDFVVGVCLGLAFVRHRSVSGALRRTPPQWVAAWTFTEVLVLTMVVSSVTLRDQLPLSIRVSALYTPIVAAIIWTFAFDRGLVSRALWIRPLQYLGKVSFAFYLAHLPVLIYLGKLTSFDGTSWTQGIIAFALCLGTAIFCHHVIENPCRRIIRGERKLRGSAAATA